MKQFRADSPSKHERRLLALQRQIKRLDRCLVDLDVQSRRISRWRLFSFALLLVGGAAVLLSWGPIPWVITSLVLLTFFIYWVWQSRKIESSAVRLRIWRLLKQDQIARLTLDWPNIPPTEPLDERFEHPFGLDIDLVGNRSLQRVIDLALTVEGSEQLRQWLLEFEPDLQQLFGRQRLVRELMQLPVFSSRLSLNALLSTGHDGSEMPSRWSSAHLLDWLGISMDSQKLLPLLVILLLLVPVNFALLFAFLRGWLAPVFLISWFIYGAITITQSRYVEPLFRDAAAIADSLRQLEAIITSLTKRSYDRFPELQALTAPLREEDSNPTELLSRTNRLLAAAGLRYNPIVSLLVNVLFPLDIFVAFRLGALQDDLTRLLPGWLAVWHELEASGSLANFGYLYPDAIFAEVSQGVEPGTAPFTAKNLGHPLILTENRVSNDFAIDQVGELVLITGSNMAGKSTFLRTLGINIRLALCGAPVLAEELATIPFRVFASITVTDSVTDGFSFFYAEVRRLKQLLGYLQESDQAPVFFLIDEIFRGTNNRERLIGSRSYVNALIGGNGCGAIATHDLELVSLAQDNPAVSNYHFRDDVIDGRMVFDYTLHTGPCPTTNALRIMRMAGLPVERFESDGQG